MSELIPIIAIIMSLAIPMLVIIGATQSIINKKNREAEIKRLIIENNIDAERAKLLIEEIKPRENKYNGLRAGAMFLGVGLGTLANHFFIHGDMVTMVFVIAGFVGLSLLVAFVVEYKLRQGDDANGNDAE
ncbi:MAG: DUF6249 domain-containing protein [Prevotella sp.]